MMHKIILFFSLFAFVSTINAQYVDVDLDKMNVAYIGVDNPLSLFVMGRSGIPLDLNKAQITVEGADAEIIGSNARSKILRVKKTGQFKIRVEFPETGTKATFEYRAKRVPDPVAKLTNNKTDGLVKAGEMKAQAGLMAILHNFDFDCRCKIQSFDLIYIPKDGEIKEARHAGGKFTGSVRQYVENTKPGDVFLFQNVKGRCPGDSSARRLNGLNFYIK